MSKKDSLKHAEHNEAVFDHLYPNKDFVDWIVTTAFYSALHYVDSKIFPINYNEKGIKFSVSDMESYAVSGLNKFGNDKHVCRIKLVERNLKEVSHNFSWLYSNCKNARYHNYNFSDKNKTCEYVTKK
jgi:hypothetical protein